MIPLIAVTGAFLLPAVNGAREKANAAACASHLRQLYNAVVTFVGAIAAVREVGAAAKKEVGDSAQGGEPCRGSCRPQDRRTLPHPSPRV